MKRDGQNEVKIRKGEFKVLVFTQERAQRLGQAGGPLILEARDGLRHESFVGGDRSGLREVTFFGKTSGTEVIVPRRLPEAQTAAGTARVGKKFYLREAKRTRTLKG